MNRREKRLALLVGVLLLAVGGKRGLDTYRGAVEWNRGLQRDAEQSLSMARAENARALRARRRLTAWKKGSLPTNGDIARSLYQDWLHKQFEQAGLQVSELRDTSRERQRTYYEQFSFAANLQGTLAQLTQFLYGFYSAPHLHRISAASLVPTKDRQMLTIGLNIDALKLPDCQRTDLLATTEAKQLERPLEAYSETIQSRNIFATHKAEETPSAQKAPNTMAAQMVVSGITLGGHGWRLAVRNKATNQVDYYRVKETISIGPWVGTVTSIDGREVILESAGKQQTLMLGDDFSKACASGEEKAESVEQRAESGEKDAEPEGHEP
jgi:hypothetical protein